MAGLSMPGKSLEDELGHRHQRPGVAPGNHARRLAGAHRIDGQPHARVAARAQCRRWLGVIGDNGVRVADLAELPEDREPHRAEDPVSPNLRTTGSRGAATACGRCRYPTPPPRGRCRPPWHLWKGSSVLTKGKPRTVVATLAKRTRSPRSPHVRRSIRKPRTRGGASSIHRNSGTPRTSEASANRGRDAGCGATLRSSSSEQPWFTSFRTGSLEAGDQIL